MDVVGRFFGSEITAEKTEEGDWKVLVEMVERRKLAGEDWKEIRLSTQCTDKVFEKAYAVALNATMDKFNDALEKTGGDGMFLESDKVEAKEE